MKKITLLGLITVLALSSWSYGATIGGPALGNGKTSIGLEIGVLSGRDFEFQDVNFDAESQSFLLNIAYGLGENVDAYLKFGQADSQISIEGESLKADKDTTWGVGLKGLITNLANDVAINGDIQYMTSENKDYEYAGVTMPDSKVEWTYWHVAFFASKVFANITPYGGIKYSDAKGDDGIDTIDAKDNFGLIGGVNYNFSPKCTGNLEIHMVDETYYSGSINFNL